MTRLLVLYNQPADPAAFDRYYFATHVPLANKMPGLRSYTVSGKVTTKSENAPYLIAELDFDNEAALKAAMDSAEGQASAADLANFAMTGATVLSYDVRSV